MAFSPTVSVTSVSPASPEAGLSVSQPSAVEVHASAAVTVKVSGVRSSSAKPNLLTLNEAAETFSPSRFWVTVTVAFFDPAVTTKVPVRTAPVVFGAIVSSTSSSPALPEVFEGVIQPLSPEGSIVQSLFAEI